MSDEDGMVEAADYYKRALDVAVAENERLKRERDDAREKFVGTVQEIQRLDATLEGERAERDRYRTALEAAGATYKADGVTFCGCGSWGTECDDMPVDEPTHSSYFCSGRIARRALTSTTPPANSSESPNGSPAAAPPVALRPRSEMDAVAACVRDAIDYVLQFDEDTYSRHIEKAVQIAAARILAAQPRGEK